MMPRLHQCQVIAKICTKLKDICTSIITSWYCYHCLEWENRVSCYVIVKSYSKLYWIIFRSSALLSGFVCHIWHNVIRDLQSPSGGAPSRPSSSPGDDVPRGTKSTILYVFKTYHVRFFFTIVIRRVTQETKENLLKLVWTMTALTTYKKYIKQT